MRRAIALVAATGVALLAFAGPAAAHPPADLSWPEKIPALILLAALLFVGFWPKSLTGPINAALTPAAAAPARVVPSAPSL